MQVFEHRGFAGDHNAARCIAIETVDQLHVAFFRPQQSQALDQAKIEATAAVDCQPRRLVQHPQALVFVEQLLFKEIGPALRHRFQLIALGHAERRNSHLVTGLDPVISFYTSFVNADFALAHGPVQAGLGYTLEFPLQEVIQALARILFCNFQHPHTIHNLFIFEGLINCCYSRPRVPA